MAIIQAISLSFCYEGASQAVFSGLDFHMDSSWRLGLIGRNGRGKTTLLRLLVGDLQGGGQIISPRKFYHFPFAVQEDRPAQEALIDAFLPYTAWEREMEEALRSPAPAALERYGEIEQHYAANHGYQVRDLLARQAGLLGFDSQALLRPLSTFSPGERTRLCLAALFMHPGGFVLLDEPTNHLDQAGRQQVTRYLAQQKGFLLASHDRDLLDAVCDHMLALEKTGARVMRGNYSTYRHNRHQEDQNERLGQEKALKEVARLKAATARLAGYGQKAEARKFGSGAFDRGFLGAKSARIMQKAKNAQARAQTQLETAQGLLKNLEYTSKLALEALTAPGNTLLRLENVSFSYGDQEVLAGLNLQVCKGDRLHLKGGNGAGKSTLLRLITGQLPAGAGSLWRMPGLVIASQPQTAHHLRGTPRLLATQQGLPLSRFLMFLRKFDLPQEAFDQDCQHLSLGQRKKVLLSLALCQPAHLYLFDEPLNDIDTQSREQVQEMLCSSNATVVFIEHEETFCRACRTRSFCL